jgi:hypothetical protein
VAGAGGIISVDRLSIADIAMCSFILLVSEFCESAFYRGRNSWT